MFRVRINIFHVLQMLFLLHTSANADDKTVLKFLLATPISRMEYSLDKLSTMLNLSANELGVRGFAASYNDFIGRISIVANCLNCNVEITQISCSRFIDKIRALAEIDENGKPYDPKGSSFSDYFKSSVEASIIDPDGFQKQIDKIIYITVVISKQNEVRCEAPLLGAAGSFTKLPN